MRSDFEIAFDGGGAKPEAVTLRELAALLNAAQDFFDAVGEELSIKDARAALVQVHTSSAGYQFSTTKTHLFAAARDAIAHRGSKNRARVRNELRRLCNLAPKGSRVRARRMNAAGKPTAKPVYFVLPLSSEDLLVHETTIYGRVVGVLERSAGGGFSVNIDRDDGGRVSMDASESLFVEAARNLRKPVCVTAEGQWDVEARQDTDWRMLSLEPFKEADFIDAMESVRAELDAKDVALDVDTMLSNLRG